MNKIIRNLGLSAVIAASAALALNLGNVANAAPNQNSSRSNNAEALGDTLDEISSLVTSIEENIRQAEALQATLSEQASSLSEARAAASDSSSEMLSQLEDARKAFEDSVAPFLDSATVEQVSLNFQKIEFEYSPQRDAIDDDSDGDTIEDIEAFSSSLSAATSALEEIKEAAAACKAGYDLKMAKKV